MTKRRSRAWEKREAKRIAAELESIDEEVTCKSCGQRIVPRDEGPLFREFCGMACEFMYQRPERENEPGGLI